MSHEKAAFAVAPVLKCSYTDLQNLAVSVIYVIYFK